MTTQANIPEAIRLTLQNSLDEKRQDLAALSGMTPVLLNDLTQELQNEHTTFDTQLRLYRETVPRMIAQGTGAADFARMLSYPEFGRRPAKAVNLETLGLMAVRYPALENVTALPGELKEAKLTRSDWKNFSRYASTSCSGERCLRFYHSLAKVTRHDLYPELHSSPDRKEHRKFHLIWPQYSRNRQHRLVRLLERAAHGRRRLGDLRQHRQHTSQTWKQLT